MKSEEAVYNDQVRGVIGYVREEYGNELEFLWRDGNAVWRNSINRKWYGVLLKVKGESLGLASKKELDVIDLRVEKGMARDFVASRGAEGIRLAYHMNKENWITVILNWGISIEEVLALIDRSYGIVAAG